MKPILVLLAFFPLLAHADRGPFGLQPGMRLGEIQRIATLEKVNEYTYRTSSLPAGNPSFDDYRLIITPQDGLCKVIAWTPDLTSNNFGEGVEDKFSGLYNALSEKYGPGTKYDFLRSGSIWNEPRDWMMALKKEDRTLAAFWPKKADPLPEGMSAIKLEAHGVSADNALIELGYEFSNFEICSTRIKEEQNSSL